MDSDKAFEEGVQSAEKFFQALVEYLGLPQDKEPETVVKAAFGAVEFACLVGIQAQIPEKDFKDTVDAIWTGLMQRHAHQTDKNNGEGGESEATTETEEAGEEKAV